MIVDVFQDTVCPWCRIGKQHLKLALEQWQGESVEIRYHTFFLNPDIPAEGYEFKSYMHAKGGGQVPLEQWFEAPRRAGAAVGLTFNFEKIEHAPNSLLSHRLIALAPADKKEAMIDAIYDAYFEFGRNIGDLDVLTDIAAQQGLDADDIRRRLLTDEAADHVLEEAEQAHKLGITGVPFFVVNNMWGLSGAQPVQIMLRALKQAEMQP